MTTRDDPHHKVTPLFGATPEALLAASERAIVKAELAHVAAEAARESASNAHAAAQRAERGAWAAHANTDRLRRQHAEAHNQLIERLLSVEHKLEKHAERTAKEIIRLTAEQTRIARQGGSHPDLEHAAKLGIRIAELAIEDEETEVRERKEKAQRRSEVRALVITWATRAAIVLGPIITAVLMRHCGQ